MTPYELQQLSEPLSQLYQQIEDDLINNIADYLAKQSLDTATAQWKIKALAGLGKLSKQNIKLIAKRSGVSSDMVYEVLHQASLNAIKDYEPGFKKLVKQGILDDISIDMEQTAEKAITSYARQAKDHLNMVNTVMGYKSKTVASKLINGIADKQNQLDKLNKATGKVVSGIESRQSAMRQCIHEMCQSGIPAFVDKKGREWSPEAYINMDIRTTANNAGHQAQFDRLDDYDIDLIEISSHPGARPLCAPYQGRIFDRKNKSRKYPPFSSTSYGQPAGLFGINCGHFAYPYIPGVSVQRYFPIDKDKNDKLYKLSQEQRALERKERAFKRERECLKRTGDVGGAKAVYKKQLQASKKLKQFCEDNKLTYKPDRTRIVR